MDDRDSGLGRRLHGAYDRMAPSPEVEERMLANLLAHACGHAPAGVRRATRGRTAARPARRLRKAVLPLAACLVLLAGVGVIAAGGAQNPLDALRASCGNFRNSSYAPDAGGSGAVPESGTIPESDVAAPESGGDGTDDDADSDARYPFVRLSSGELIRIALGEDGPLVADPAFLGNELETARAFNRAEAQTAPCTVFATTDESHPFAVRFDDGQAFLADPVDEG